MALTLAQFDSLVAEHGPALYRVAYRLIGDRHEAEDVVQESFRSAWASRERYEPGRGDRAWLVTILRRRIVDGFRKRPRSEQELSESWEPAAPVEPSTMEDFGDETQAALRRLPAGLRETLLLVVVGELTHQEAADLLAIPLGTVLSRVNRARSRLREWLSKGDCATCGAEREIS